MRWYAYPSYFFAGAFLSNAIPHLVMGITGQELQTPFGNPSSAVVNAVWGSANLAAAYAIIAALGWFGFGFNRRAAVTALGFIAMNLTLAYVFSQ